VHKTSESDQYLATKQPWKQKEIMMSKLPQ